MDGTVTVASRSRWGEGEKYHLGGWSVSSLQTQQGLTSTGLWGSENNGAAYAPLTLLHYECYEIVLAAAPLAALLHDVEWF